MERGDFNIALINLKLDLIAEALGVYTIDVVDEVMRREFKKADGDHAVVIDYYPPWSASGKYGIHKVVHEYMDFQWQRDRFEKWTGLKLDDLPVYDSDRALKRRYGEPHPCAVKLQRPFRIMVLTRQSEGENKPKKLIRTFLSMSNSGGGSKIDRDDHVREEKAETEEDRAFRILWNSLSGAYQRAYKTTDLDAFIEFVSTTTRIGDGDKVRKAITAVLPDRIVFPSAGNRRDGTDRIRLYWSLVTLGSVLEQQMTQVEALERARRTWESFDLEDFAETSNN